jgi:hypothetical protein
MSEDHSASQPAKTSLLALRKELAHVLGIQTVDLLIDRAVTEIGDAYPTLRAISVRGGELNVESVDGAFQNLTAEEATAASSALIGVMLLVLARILGRRVAESIAESINRSEVLRTVRI